MQSTAFWKAVEASLTDWTIIYQGPLEATYISSAVVLDRVLLLLKALGGGPYPLSAQECQPCLSSILIHVSEDSVSYNLHYASEMPGEKQYKLAWRG